MRFSKPSAPVATSPDEQVFFQCSKCLLNYVRKDLRRFDFNFGQGVARICVNCCHKLVLEYGIESSELWALAVVIGLERQCREEARNDVRYKPMDRATRDRLIRALDVSLATAANKVSRMHQAVRDYVALVKKLEARELGDRAHEAFPAWAAAYKAQWRADHALTPDLQNLFGFGAAVQANEEFGVFV